MKHGTISIRKISSENIHVRLELSEDRTVWMTKNEIATLFNVYHSSVEANLRSLFKSNSLLKKTARKEEYHPLENGQSCVVEYFNLEVIIALSYQLNGYACVCFRQWIAKQVVTNSKNPPPVIVLLGTETMN